MYSIRPGLTKTGAISSNVSFYYPVHAERGAAFRQYPSFESLPKQPFFIVLGKAQSFNFHVEGVVMENIFALHTIIGVSSSTGHLHQSAQQGDHLHHRHPARGRY